jgi:hypothetical protein
MKTTKYIIAATLAVLGLNACEKLLDTENYTASNTANFPASFEEAEMMVTAIYSNMNHMSSRPSAGTFYFVSELASDDRFGGSGGQSFDKLLVTGETAFDFSWAQYYKGIYLANSAIEGLKLMENDVDDREKYEQLLGESYFMRAYNYYEMGTLFGRVPLLTSTTQDSNSPQVEPDVLFGQIASDLKQAIDLMSDKPWNAYVEFGHATKWAAEALMARAFLFYTGFFQKDSMPLAEGGSVTKQEVISWIDDCVNNSGHDLVGDYRNLWTYTNKYTVDDYPYTAGVKGVDGQPLLWAGNGNKEEVFSVKYMNYCGYYYPGQEGYSNFYIPFFGFAGTNGTGNTFPWGNGNGVGTVNSGLWEDWNREEPGDLRIRASILSIEEEVPDYDSGDISGQWEDCGYWAKKTLPVLAKAAYERQGSWVSSIFWAAYPEFDQANNYGITNWGGHFQDLILIRFADVLLMQSELKEDASGMNRVRARAGLQPVGYSLEALQRERRHELCFEGVRWNDIRRWHIAEQALSGQNNRAMNNAGADVVLRDGRYAERYKATEGFFPIPASQIRLSAGVLQQNAGWKEGDNYLYTVWNFD